MSKWKYNTNDKIRKRKNRGVIRHQITEIKMSNFCQRCGIEDSEHPEIFDFDHQYNKKECVSNLIQQASLWYRIWDEIKKCTILCANCHRIKTKEDRDNNVTHEVIVSSQGELF